MDLPADLQGRRLHLSLLLSRRAARILGGRIGEGEGAVLKSAILLGEDVERMEERNRFSCQPPYPGVTAGPEAVGESVRMLLACRVSDRDGTEIGVIFTTLISGRLPQTSIAPAGTLIPSDWHPVPWEGP